MDCKFCIQSRHNPDYEGYPLLEDRELLRRIKRLAATPVRRIGLVASGKSLVGREFERLLKLLASLPSTIRQRLCASLGQIDASQLAELRKVGIERYHHNLETSQNFYPEVCSTQTWESRRNTVVRAQSAGFSVCSGGIFGLGESWLDRRELALSLKKLGIADIPLNFIHPQPGTPFGKMQPLPAEEALEIIALFRQILPDSNLRICGGRPLTFGVKQSFIFAAGANALMTGDYLTTSGFGLDADLALLGRLGLRPDF